MFVVVIFQEKMADNELVVNNPHDIASGDCNNTSSSREIALRTGNESSNRKHSSNKHSKSNSKRDSTGHASPLTAVGNTSFDLEAMSNRISSILLPMLNKSIDEKIKPVLDSVNILQNDMDSLRSSGSDNHDNAIDNNSEMDDFTKHLMNRDSDEDIESDLEPDGNLSVDNILDDLTSTSSNRGPVMPERVASFTQFMLDQKLEHKALMELIDSVPIPENMDFLKSHDLPEQIVNRIKKNVVTHDGKFTLIQNCIFKGIIPVIGCLAQARANEDAESVKTFSDSVRLLMMAISKINNLRYVNLRNALPSGWQELCDRPYPYGPMFGENLQATVTVR